MTASPQQSIAATAGTRVAKTTVAKAYLRSVNPWSDVALLESDLQNLVASDFSDTDCAIVGVDSHRARLQASRMLGAARRPYVDVGIDSSLLQARVTVCDPARTLGGNSACASCVACAWGETSLARAGEDVGYPCAGLDTGDPNASTLLMGHRGATLAVCEAMALAGAIDLAPSIGCELRDDIASKRLIRFDVPANADGCGADHALGSSRRTQLAVAPANLRLGALAQHCGFRPDDIVVLGSRELVVAAICVSCTSPGFPYRWVGSSRASCPHCGGDMAPVRRARRVRWATAAQHMAGAAASEWFAPGDCFALVGEEAPRVFEFPASPTSWERGQAWRPEDARRFERLPANYRLDRIRQSRLAIIGLGHAGAAVLHQLAPLPWAGILLLDRDHFEAVNSPAHALSAALSSATFPQVASPNSQPTSRALRLRTHHSGKGTS